MTNVYICHGPSSNMQQKGVSPLIATIILIALVVAIAGIAAQFLTSFQQARQQEIREEGEAVVECGLASIEIDTDTVSYTGSSTRLILTIENTGRTALGLKEIIYSNTSAKISEVVLAVRNDNGLPINASSPLAIGSIVTIRNNSVLYRPDRITVTTSCPGVTATIENDTSTNLYEPVFD